MSLAPDPPIPEADVIIVSFTKNGQWSNKTKFAVLVLGLVVYVYLLLLLKTVYLKSQRLDRIDTLAMQTEKLLRDVHAIDQTIAATMQRLGAMHADY